LQRDVGAHGIVNAKPDAIVVPEIKLRKIAVQMLFGTMLVNAFHAAFEIENTPSIVLVWTMNS